MNKIKDLFAVAKYRKMYNAMENKYNTLLEKYTELLEKDRSMIDDNKLLEIKLKDANAQIKQFKKEKAES